MSDACHRRSERERRGHRAPILEAEGSRIVTQVEVRSVREIAGEIVATVVVRGEMKELRAEKLLVATGRPPNTDTIAVERASVKLGDAGQVLVDEFLRTNVPHIFAAGDVIGQTRCSG